MTINLDQQFSLATSKRITALFANKGQNPKGDGGDTATATEGRDYSTKNRSKELKRLASTLDLPVSRVKDLLANQRSKMGGDSEKAHYIDWLFAGNGDDSKKRPRKKSVTDMNELAPSDAVSETAAQSSKRKKPTRPIRPNSNPDTSDSDETMEDATTNTSSVQDPSLLSSIKFEDVAEINPKSKRAIKEILKLESMTEIQSKTFTTAVSGTDVLGRARTGTGKTLAFLVPALERLLASDNFQPGKQIGVLVISPTRELAIQIGDQASKLLTFHNNLSCQVMYGGTKTNRDMNALNKRLPSVLIATPGRLLDHMENTKLNSGRKFGYDVMRETSILVLDETDRLLDMGFRREIAKILAFLPKQNKRQTLLFSATVPQELKKIMAENMKPDFVEVDCIQDKSEGPGGHTNALVDQTYAILPNFESLVMSSMRLVQDSMQKDPDHKIVVFFPTARMVGYFSEFFNVGLGIEVIELHSKKSQGYRNKASDKFRKAKRAILFTSDVSARGVDYPDVTGVIQVGLPESRDQYIHRLGRTGRAGKKGEGIVLLAPFESKFIRELKNIDITLNKRATELIASPMDEEASRSFNAVMSRIRSGDAKLTTSAEQCYQSFLGYYRGHMKRTDIHTKEDLVNTANTLAKAMGLKEQPGLTKKAVGKMGLKGIPNIRIISPNDIKKKNRG